MEKLQAKLDDLQITGATLSVLLRNVHSAVDRVRTAKMGALDPADKWVPPVTASPLAVKSAKLVSLNAKRRATAQVDRVLLELVRLEEFAVAAQHSSFKHAYIKQLRVEADQDAGDDRKERQAQQDARVEEAAKRSELAAARKRRRVLVESDGEPSDFDLR
jgi:hypothetical protein